MRIIFENVIKSKNFDLPDMLNKISEYHISGKLTDDEKNTLINMARAEASVANGVDMFAKLVELEKRIITLEAGEKPSVSETPEEYVIGKWYYNGDKVTFNGKVYTCVAPEGVVCTWSPDEYPAYWE